MDEAIRARLLDVQRRYNELTDEMGRPDVAADFEKVNGLAKERAEIQAIASLFEEYQRVEESIAGARALMAEDDADLRALAEQELADGEARLAELDGEVLRALLPKNPRDDRDVIVEIRAGAGGEEAALFAAELYRMYARYAERHRWHTEILNASESDKHGFKEVVFELRGRGAYSRLKFESGVHRVQRVPETEAQGRIHTSACTVAVMPEADPIADIEINPADLRIDTFRASGAGGQHVNRTDSAVRITHLPTGLVVECQDDRSQHRNRAQAMAVLASRLLDRERSERQRKEAATRKSLIGSGDRSERIRTYNFPQGRVTDHRINLTLYRIDAIVDGDLDEIVTALQNEFQAEQLAALAGEEA